MRSNLHHRRLTAFSAAAERKLLTGIALRLPRAITPNILTLCGLCGGFMTGLGFLFGSLSVWWLALAVAGYVVHWFGDSLDGTLARVRGVERPRFGLFIDQSADLLTTAFTVGGLGLSGWVDFTVGLGVYTGYLLLAVIVHLRATVTGEYDIAHGGIGPTEGRIIMIVLTAMMAVFPPDSLWRWHGLSGFDGFLIIMIFWAVVTCCLEVYNVSRRLAQEEPNRS